MKIILTRIATSLSTEEGRKKIFGIIASICVVTFIVPLLVMYMIGSLFNYGIFNGLLPDFSDIADIGDGIFTSTEHEILPIMADDYVITLEYGATSSPYSPSSPHAGIDFVGQESKNMIMNMLPGTVVESNNDCGQEGYLGNYCGGGFGNHVVVESNYKGQKLRVIYGHMKYTLVNVGDPIKQFETIGEMGSSGNVTGAHLHFEAKLDGQLIDSNMVLDYVNNQYNYACPEYIEKFNDVTMEESSTVNYDNVYVKNICENKGEISTDISDDKKEIMSAVGIKESDYNYVDYIVSHESSWDYKATNSSSGAYGLCQALPGNKMATSGSDWKTNPITQMDWCNNYAEERYGSWKSAYEFWIKNEWW
ncbi:MAG: peptidoglycan DD-metalloendopeptidase family protein [Bacilli bacterium]